MAGPDGYLYALSAANLALDWSVVGDPVQAGQQLLRLVISYGGEGPGVHRHLVQLRYAADPRRRDRLQPGAGRKRSANSTRSRRSTSAARSGRASASALTASVRHDRQRSARDSTPELGESESIIKLGRYSCGSSAHSRSRLARQCRTATSAHRLFSSTRRRRLQQERDLLRGDAGHDAGGVGDGGSARAPTGLERECSAAPAFYGGPVLRRAGRHHPRPELPRVRAKAQPAPAPDLGDRPAERRGRQPALDAPGWWPSARIAVQGDHPQRHLLDQRRQRQDLDGR